MDQESGYQWVAVRSVMISYRLLFYFWTNLPQVWWPREAGITHLSERCRWPNNFNSLCNNNSVRQIKLKQIWTGFFFSQNTYIELRGGNGYSYGNVYATNENGYFGPVCDNGWGTNEAGVVCRYVHLYIHIYIKTFLLLSTNNFSFLDN